MSAIQKIYTVSYATRKTVYQCLLSFFGSLKCIYVNYVYAAFRYVYKNLLSGPSILQAIQLKLNLENYDLERNLFLKCDKLTERSGPIDFAKKYSTYIKKVLLDNSFITQERLELFLLFYLY